MAAHLWPARDTLHEDQHGIVLTNPVMPGLARDVTLFIRDAAHWVMLSNCKTRIHSLAAAKL